MNVYFTTKKMKRLLFLVPEIRFLTWPFNSPQTHLPPSGPYVLTLLSHQGTSGPLEEELL